MRMNVTVFGAGYVGLVTGTCLAELGHDVHVVEIDQDKLAQLQNGHSTIFEAGLEDLLQKNLANKRLTFTADAEAAVNHAEIIFIAVGTPEKMDGSADLKYVEAVAAQIAKFMQSKKIIVNKSTVPIGTAEKIRTIIKEKNSTPFSIVSNPEFLKEGSAVNDFMYPDRIIIGTSEAKAAEKIADLYQPILAKRSQLIKLESTQAAEMSKYSANAFLAMKISFINFLSQIAEVHGVNIQDVQKAMGSDSRISPLFLNAGAGFGGSCFPKDLSALLSIAKQSGVSAELLEATITTNQKQKQVLFEKLSKFFDGELSGKKIAVWGLAFKPNTDDIREASSLTLLELLWKKGALVQAYDPKASDNIKKYYPHEQRLTLCASAESALTDADVLVIVTEWDEFKKFDLTLIKEKLNFPVIFDGRNLFDAAKVNAAGLSYYGIGYGDLVAVECSQ